MATNNAGLYLSTGIQSNGVTKSGASGEVTIYSGGEKIYPRIAEAGLNDNSFGGFKLYTWRTGNDKQSNTYANSNTNILPVARQGAKSQTGYYGTKYYHESWGHIEPISMVRIPTAEVTSARIKCKSNGIGIHGQKIFTFRVSRNNEKTGSFTGTVYQVGVNDTGKVDFYLDDNATLRQLLTEFLREGTCLMLYNGETRMNISAAYNDGTGYGSANYAGITSFVIESLTYRYQP